MKSQPNPFPTVDVSTVTGGAAATPAGAKPPARPLSPPQPDPLLALRLLPFPFGL